jgi:hypothetical protein
MNLAIAPKARDYILARGGVVHLIPHDGLSLC